MDASDRLLTWTASDLAGKMLRLKRWKRGNCMRKKGSSLGVHFKGGGKWRTHKQVSIG